MVLLPLFSLILLPEYVQGLGDPETKSLLYRGPIGPLRMVDAVLLGIIAAHGIVWASSRSMRLHFPRALAMPVWAFWPQSHGNDLRLAEWRNEPVFRLAGIGVRHWDVCRVCHVGANTGGGALRHALFAGYMALRIGMIYASFLRGGGDMIVGVRIPVFDGPTLSAIVFTAVLASWMSGCADRRWRKLGWTSLSAAAYLLVLLCFRRTFWAELGVATGLLLLLQKRGRRRKVAASSGSGRGSGGDAGAGILRAHAEPGLHNWRDGVQPGQSRPCRRSSGCVGASATAAPARHWIGAILSDTADPGMEGRIRDGAQRPAPRLAEVRAAGLACYVWFHFAMFRWLRRRWRELARNRKCRSHAD